MPCGSSKAKTVREYILSQNMAAEFFTVAGGPGYWASKLMPAECWEQDYGITTVEQLMDHLQAEHERTMEKERRRNYYNDWYEEQERIHILERRMACIERNRQWRKYSAHKPLTYNPFQVLKGI